MHDDMFRLCLQPSSVQLAVGLKMAVSTAETGRHALN